MSKIQGCYYSQLLEGGIWVGLRFSMHFASINESNARYCIQTDISGGYT